jgi:hypothetical protein
MAAKDYIYLSFIALSALVFYLYGVQTGVSRCRKVLAKFFDCSDDLDESPHTATMDDKPPFRPFHPYTFRRVCRSRSKKSRSELAWFRVTRGFPGR